MKPQTSNFTRTNMTLQTKWCLCFYHGELHFKHETCHFAKPSADKTAHITIALYTSSIFMHFPSFKTAVFLPPIQAHMLHEVFTNIWAIMSHYWGIWYMLEKKNPAAWSNMGRLSQRSSASSIICCRFRSASSAFWRSTYVRVARGKKDQRSTCSFVPLSQNIFELLPQVEYPSTCMCVCACIVTY